VIKKIRFLKLKCSVPGDSFIVKKQCKTFEEGADIAIASLERQIKKRKQKLRARA
jgi:putative sigma-54 modulation protein